MKQSEHKRVIAAKLRQIHPFLLVIACAVCILACVIGAGALSKSYNARHSEKLSDFNTGWYYYIGEIKMEVEELPSTYTAGTLGEMSFFHDLSEIGNDMVLCLKTKSEYLCCKVGGEVIYESVERNGNYFGIFTHIIPLSYASDVGTLELQFECSEKNPYIYVSEMKYGSLYGMISNLVYEDLLALLCLMLSLVLGIILVVVYAISYGKRKQEADMSFLHLGLFLINAAAWIYTNIDIVSFSTKSPLFVYFISYASFSMLPVFFLQYVRIRSKKKMVWPLNVLSIIFPFVFFANLMLQVFNVVYLENTLIVIHALLVLAIAAVIYYVFTGVFIDKNKDMIATAIGIVIIVCGAIVGLGSYYKSAFGEYGTPVYLSIIIFFIILCNSLIAGTIQTNIKSQRAQNEQIRMQVNVIVTMANLIESRDGTMSRHIDLTCNLCKIIAEELKRQGHHPDILTDSYITQLLYSASLHDIGKIAVSDTILKKQGRLTPEEFEEMKKHTLNGSIIISELLGDSVGNDYLTMACNIALYHHEWWDGSGYPYGIKGEEIPLCARIMAVADVFDALISPRCYKKNCSFEKATQMIQEMRGTHFDPAVIDAFMAARSLIMAYSMVGQSFEGTTEE